MNRTVTPTWQVANHRYLMAAIATVRQRLQQKSDFSASSRFPDTDVKDDATMTEDALPALEQLRRCFQLSPFERGILLLCAGMELGSAWGKLCAAAGPPHQPVPTFELAQQVLASPHWSAFLPHGPLRAWQLVELGPSNALLASPLRLSERILHELMGFPGLDDRLSPLVTPLAHNEPLVPSHQQIATQMVTAWQSPPPNQPWPLMQLCGVDRPSLRAIAATACQALGLSLYVLASKALPTNPNELQQFIRLWEREDKLGPVALLVDWETVHRGEPNRLSGMELLMDTLNSPLILLSRDRRSLNSRPLITYDIHSPIRQEQIQLWHHHLQAQADSLDGFVAKLTGQFDLSRHQIQSASLQAQAEVGEKAGARSQEPGARSQEPGDRDDSDAKIRVHLTTPGSDANFRVAGHQDKDPAQLRVALWEACRVQARPQLDDLAQRLTPREGWEDLVLPEREKTRLQEIVAHVRQRSRVYDDWGFGQKSSRGLGISALFAGTSGTGKTMAAGVLGMTLQLDVYRIDLSALVSKYIGETEKNLRRVFDTAESGGVILLFDEADALFGKRSDVKDSHDRYANMEVSYLLQRMEAYRGLAILTTNMKDAIDAAFMRRIRFVITFPFPDYTQRLAIWQRIFPTAVPTQGLDYRQLAKLNVAGGNIRNIALTAAFLAADAEQSVTMAHLLRAAQSEYSKLERPLPPTEVRDWVTDKG